ncbi:hypothetical protein MRX96_052702 [Rhipicephalus microplus]
MGAHVALAVGCLRKCSRTLGALEGLLPAVRPHVVFHVGHVVRGVQALAADQRIFPCESFFLVPLHPYWGGPCWNARTLDGTCVASSLRPAPRRRNLPSLPTTGETTAFTS